MNKIETRVEISATPERVWEVFSKTSDYPLWNPFIIEVKGAFEENARARICIRFGSLPKLYGFPTIIRLVEGAEMVAKISIGPMFSGTHYFKVEAINESKTYFIQEETFSGIVPSLFWLGIKPQVLKAFTKMIIALKQRCETK